MIIRVLKEYVAFKCDSCNKNIQRPIHEALVCPFCKTVELCPTDAVIIPDMDMITKAKTRKERRTAQSKESARQLGVPWKMAKSYAGALLRWHKAGYPTRTQGEVDRIHEEHCKPCENNIKGRCKLCGCNVNRGMALLNKIKMATEKCPVKKWEPNPDSLPTMVVVTGPNRSGTSCVAGVLHTLGVSMGKEFIPTNKRNSAGYFEDTTLWEFTQPRPRRKHTDEQITEWFHNWAKTRQEAPIVGCKHPRLCNMLPQMAEVWPKLKVIAISRPAADIAASLHRAGWGGKRHRVGEMKRLQENRDEALSSLQIPSLSLEYNRVVQEPETIVDEIISFLGIEPTDEQRRAAIAHVDPSMRHHHSLSSPVAPVDVVYPLNNGSKWDNNEIRYSLRSLEKYAANLGRVFVVTEKLPPWMKNVVHVPVADTRGRNKDANIIDKIRGAIKAGISERFIFASDDQYLIAPTDLATLPVSYAKWKTGKSKWWKRFNRTQEYLHSIGKPTTFYESHLFQPHSATQFERAVADCDYSKNPGYTVNTVAYNKYEPLPKSVLRSELSGSVMANYGTLTPEHHKERMKQMLPESSKYEEPATIKTDIIRPRVYTFWTGPMPEIIKLCLETMKRNIPDIEIWTLERWREEYDGSLGPWSSIKLRRPNVQSDILRYWLLSTYGGIWLDADYIAFRDIREVWDQTVDYIGYMDKPKWNMPYTALMGGHPDSPIVKKQCELARNILKTRTINKKAGPRLTQAAFQACPDAARSIVPASLIHPMRWRRHLAEMAKDAQNRYAFHPDAYGLMLLGHVCRFYNGWSRARILDDYSVVGQAFRKATGETPTYWHSTTTPDDLTPKSGVVEWCLTYECSLNCTDCIRLGYLSKGIPTMTLEDARQFISQCRDMGWQPRKILITGGEPTLHPDIVEFCRIAQDLCPGQVDVWSHGYGEKTQQVLQECKEKGGATLVASTLKLQGSISQLIKDALIAPCDGSKGGREPCKWHTSKALHCGISVDHLGYTSCPNGGVYSAVLGLGVHTKRLSDLFDAEFVDKQTRELCRHCGMFYYGNSNTDINCQIIHGAAMSPTWQKAVDRLEAANNIKDN